MPGEPGSRMDQQFCNNVRRIADALETLVQLVADLTDFDLEGNFVNQDLIDRAKQRVFDDKAAGKRGVVR